MQVAQRATSVTGITGSGYNTVDRFRLGLNDNGTWTQTQSTDVPTGSGFASSLKMDCTTADAAVAAGSFHFLSYRLEAQDCQLFKKGTSSAEYITVAFWIKSNKTGTFTVEILDPVGSQRTISQTFTIDSGSTWEKKVLSFVGDTSSPQPNTNALGLSVNIWMTGGSNYTSGTLQTAWGAKTDNERADTSINIADSTSNEYYLTGVQIEVGEYDATTIPPFQHELFGDNLTRCKRYYQQSYSIGTKAGTPSTQGGSTMVYIPATGNTLRYTLHHYGMRAAPTFVEYSPETGTSGIGSYEGSGDTNSEAISTTFANEHSTLLYNTGMGFTGSFYWQYTLSAEL
jgi:hypothetical protein